MYHLNVAGAIGNTPTVLLSRFCKEKSLKGQLFAKLEHLNPGFSKKDRIARRMIIEAKAKGELKEHQPIIELTSGNTGTGLAIVSASFGHPFTALMSKGNSIERAKMMKALGTNVVLVDQHPDSSPGFVSAKDLDLVEEEARRLTQALGAFRADQFSLIANENAHYYETGPEIWKCIKPNAFVDFAGTGGTFSGISKYLKEQNSEIKCVWVEPSNTKHQIQGGGYLGRNLLFQDLARTRNHIDQTMQVNDEECIQAARDLARFEGIFGGFSTGANAVAASRILRQMDDDSFSVVFLVCDSGLKYLSLDLYE